MKSFLFAYNDFGTLAFLFGQSCLCVTFTSWSTLSFGMLLSKLSNRKTHVCTSRIRMIRFFLPFIVNCSQVAMFQIMLALCLYGQRERGWSTKCGQAWTGVGRGGGKGGFQKFPNLCRHSLWMTPKNGNWIQSFCFVYCYIEVFI